MRSGAAAGLVDYALGTDSGGSIRIPAACCGVVGFKPTWGLVPLDGCFPLTPSFDHAGPMARDVEGCETQFRASFLLGCVGAWSLHPVQIAIAKKVYSPDPEEVAFAKKVIAAIPDGRGVHMIDGKMQDDATWKQCKVMVNLAEMLARKDPELAEAYGLAPVAA